MPEHCSRRTFLAGGTALLAGGGMCFSGFALQPASARAAPGAAASAPGVVTLYMGVPEIDTSGKAQPYRPRRRAPLSQGERIDWMH